MAPPDDGIAGLRRLGMTELPQDLELRRASEIAPRPVRWLWPGRIARGKVTVLAGHPGLGKSQLVLDIVARVTTGGQWPVEGMRAECGSAVILSAEDDAEDTIIPRLMAAGADLDRCHIVGAVREAGDHRRGFCLGDDLARLAAALDEIGDVALIDIDPITAYLGDTDSHRNAEVRAALAPLAELAARYRAAVLAVSHLRKSLDGDAILRVSGSLAFVAAARAAYLVIADANDRDRRLFLPAKNNIGTDRTGYAYRVVPHWLDDGLGGIATCRVEWESEAVTISADEALDRGGPGRPPAERDEATAWLRDLLAAGPVPAEEIRAASQAADIAWRTIERTRATLRIIVARVGERGVRGGGGWRWSLPDADGTAGSAEAIEL